jgi:metallophosphoesterase (TIGR03767 family)
MTSLRRFVATAAATAAVLAVVLAPTTAVPTASVACGLTTLQGQIAVDGDGLRCEAGQPLVVRTDLAKTKTPRLPTPLLSFAALTDFQLMDEESPLRGEWADKCETHPAKAAFRFAETMIPELLNAEIRAVNQIAVGPTTGRPFDFAVQLGDAADNQQLNEVRSFIDLLDGDRLVDPDSGRDGYEGVQSVDPYPSPVEGVGIRDLANEPFYAVGLRRPDGTALPWYSVMGNHDMKVQGTLPNDDEAWKAFARAWVVGQLKVQDLAPDQQERVCSDPALLTSPEFWMEVAATPGTTKLVTADANRRLLDRTQWIAEHLPPAEAQALDAAATGSPGLPAGHGFAEANRCRDEQGELLERACYSWDQPPFHFVALDTAADEGLETGNIDEPQWQWLRRDLKAHSACVYESDSTGGCVKTGHAPSLIIAFSHHTESTSTNAAPRADGTASHDGDELRRLFLNTPSLILHLSGHTHFNKIWAHPGEGRPGGFWEVNTSAVADWPHQGRTVEVVDNHDGTLSIFAVNFDAAAPVDPAAAQWTADDTPESALAPGAKNVNEVWLASAARLVGARDPQSGAASVTDDVNLPVDRNVQLLLANPFGVTKPPRFPVPVPSSGFRQPPFRFPFGFPNRFPLPAGFSGFPGVPSFPSQPFQPDQAFSQSHAFPSTNRGIGAPARTAATGPPVQGSAMLLIALGAGFWLFRARLRAWMVGARKP